MIRSVGGTVQGQGNRNEPSSYTRNKGQDAANFSPLSIAPYCSAPKASLRTSNTAFSLSLSLSVFLSLSLSPYFLSCFVRLSALGLLRLPGLSRTPGLRTASASSGTPYSACDSRHHRHHLSALPTHSATKKCRAQHKARLKQVVHANAKALPQLSYLSGC